MSNQGILLLRRLTVSLKRVPGAIIFLEPIRRIFCRRREAISVSDFDGLLKMNLRLDEHMQSQIFWYGYYSRDIVLLLNRILLPGMVVMDVGANIGEITMAAAQRVGSNGHVYSFEPMRTAYDCLTEHLKVNELRQVTPIAKGLSNKTGVATIFRAESTYKDGSRHDGLGTLFPTSSRSETAGNIKLTTMDEFCAETAVTRIDLVKIDVEGAELAVIRGGLKSIDRFKPYLIVELQTETAEDAGYKPADIIALLKTVGYRFFIIGRKARLRPMNQAILSTFQNVLCVPAGANVP